jgi:hypothetical protein
MASEINAGAVLYPFALCIAIYSLGLGLGFLYLRYFPFRDWSDATFVWAWPLVAFIAIFYLGFRGMGWLLRRTVVAGLDFVVAAATMRVLDESEWGRLVTMKIPAPELGRDQRAVFIDVSDTTGRHRIRVDPRCDTALEAVAWSYCLGPNDYRNAVRV